MFRDTIINDHAPLKSINNQNRYLFEKLIFLLDEHYFVELVSLSKKSEILEGMNTVNSDEVVLTDSRERKVEDLPIEMLNSLKVNGTLRESFELSYDRYLFIMENYTDSLIDVEKDLLTN